MLRFVGESHNLGFYTGAITWADTLDLSVEKGRIRQTFLQDAVCFFVGEAGPARELFQMAYMSVHERELVEVTFSPGIEQAVNFLLNNYLILLNLLLCLKIYLNLFHKD